MTLPVRTTLDDIEVLCKYLASKPAGVLISDAKTVLDKKYLDARKLSALRQWGLIEERDEKLFATEMGWTIARGDVQSALGSAVLGVPAYASLVERVAHREESVLDSAEVAAHFHTHFPGEASSSNSGVSDQAVCFFHVAMGAGLGQLIVGRKGARTRFEFDHTSISRVLSLSSPPQQDDESPTKPEGEAQSDGEIERQAPLPVDPEAPQLGQAIFVAHGKNHRPLEQLKSVLDGFGIPYLIAVDEAHMGRPISAKVRQTMESCNCAVFLFTADEELRDLDGNPVWRPSENVIYELGAASFLYDKKIVLMKEERVSFPSDFSDIGFIEFSEDQLHAKAMEILRELIAFGILKLST